MSNQPQAAAGRQHAWWEPVWEFVVHVAVGSALFALIFAPAVGLDLAVSAMKDAWKISEFLIDLLTFTKYAVAVLDVILYLLFMLTMSYRFVRTLWGYHHDTA